MAEQAKKNKPPKPGANKLPKGYARQVGSTLGNYTSSIYGFLYHPEANRFQEYQLAATTDETVKAALDLIRLALIASLGEYEHQDPKIQKFVRDNLEQLRTPWKLLLGQTSYTSLWAGFSMGEILWKVKGGKIWISDVPLYNPTSIYFVVDKHGRLTDNQDDILTDKASKVPGSVHKTGVYQLLPGVDSAQRIPLHKTFITTHDSQYGNPYGQSALRTVYKPWKYKIAAEEMLLVALDRYGTPVVYAVVPVGATNDLVVDPQTGVERNMTMGEAAERALATLSTGTGLVLQNPNPQDKLQVGTLTTGNNFGSSFQDAIAMWNRSIYRGLLLPSLLLDEHSGGLGAGAQTETQFEVFKQMIEGLYEEGVKPFVKQVIGRLVKINFGVDDPGDIPMEPFDPSARATLATMFEKYTTMGVADPSDLDDFNHMRRMAGLRSRDKVILKKAPSQAEQELTLAQAKQAEAGAKAQTATADVAPQQMEHTKNVGEQDLEIRKQDLDLRKKDLQQKQKVDQQKMQMDHEVKMMTAQHQHLQNMAAIRKGLVQQPQAAAPGAPAAPKPGASKPAGAKPTDPKPTDKKPAKPGQKKE